MLSIRLSQYLSFPAVKTIKPSADTSVDDIRKYKRCGKQNAYVYLQVTIYKKHFRNFAIIILTK